MKFLKSTLFAITLLMMQPVSARERAARKGAATTTKAPTTPPTPVTPSALPPRNLPSTNSFQSYLQQVKDMKSADVINNQGMFTDKFKNFVKSSGLSSDFRNSLLEAGAHLHAQFTGVDGEDQAIISIINTNINRANLPGGANYQQFMKSFKQNPILPDGSVSSDWIEGAAMALRADGLDSMDQLTDAMTNILTDFVLSSSIAKIRDGLAPTLRSFESNWKRIQQKGIGEATNPNHPIWGDKTREQVLPTENPIWGRQVKKLEKQPVLTERAKQRLEAKMTPEEYALALGRDKYADEIEGLFAIGDTKGSITLDTSNENFDKKFATVVTNLMADILLKFPKITKPDMYKALQRPLTIYFDINTPIAEYDAILTRLNLIL